MKRALITGITGQDGSYLAELLLEKGYEVHGMTRRASLPNTQRIEHLLGKITLHDGDLSDSSSIIRIMNIVRPDEVYNLAAQSHVQVSFDVPEYSGDVDALGVLRAGDVAVAAEHALVGDDVGLTVGKADGLHRAGADAGVAVLATRLVEFEVFVVHEG